jgi:hypothetical protein
MSVRFGSCFTGVDIITLDPALSLGMSGGVSTKSTPRRVCTITPDRRRTGCRQLLYADQPGWREPVWGERQIMSDSNEADAHKTDDRRISPLIVFRQRHENQSLTPDAGSRSKVILRVTI